MIYKTAGMRATFGRVLLAAALSGGAWAAAADECRIGELRDERLTIGSSLELLEENSVLAVGKWGDGVVFVDVRDVKRASVVGVAAPPYPLAVTDMLRLSSGMLAVADGKSVALYAKTDGRWEVMDVLPAGGKNGRTITGLAETGGLLAGGESSTGNLYFFETDKKLRRVGSLNGVKPGAAGAVSVAANGAVVFWSAGAKEEGGDSVIAAATVGESSRIRQTWDVRRRGNAASLWSAGNDLFVLMSADGDGSPGIWAADVGNPGKADFRGWLPLPAAPLFGASWSAAGVMWAATVEGKILGVDVRRGKVIAHYGGGKIFPDGVMAVRPAGGVLYALAGDGLLMFLDISCLTKKEKP